MDPAEKSAGLFNMKKAIIVTVDKRNEKVFYDITRSKFLNYARVCDADFIEISCENKKSEVGKAAVNYDRVAYFRSDIVIKDGFKNLFNLVPSDKIGVCYPLVAALRAELGKFGSIDANCLLPWTVNCGIVVCSKQHNVWTDYATDEEWARSLPIENVYTFNGGLQYWMKNYHQLIDMYRLIHLYGINDLYSVLSSSDLSVNNVESEGFYYNHQLLEYTKDENDIIGGRVFITETMLIEDSVNLIKKLPPIKGIIGCPRSGLIPASIIATKLSIPLYSFSNGELIKLSDISSNGGYRMHRFSSDENLPLLIMDDTVFYGHQMRRSLSSLREKFPNESFITGCIYCYPESKSVPDFYEKGLSYPHILEWNIFGCGYMEISYIDFDGIFSPDVPPEIDSNESLYVDYITNVQPIKQNIPTLFSCGAVCTGRLEKYRDITEKWLLKNKVRYNKLIMLNGTKEWRDSNHSVNVGKFKAAELAKSNCSFFIESCDYQSRIISDELKNMGKKAFVICPNSKKVYS